MDISAKIIFNMYTYVPLNKFQLSLDRQNLFNTHYRLLVQEQYSK